MFEIPRLSPTNLRKIAVCAHFDLSEEGQISRAALEQYDTFLVGKLEVTGQEDIYIRRIVDVDDSTCHVHVEAVLASALGFTPPDINPLDEVLAEIPELKNFAVSTTFWGRRKVARNKLPDEGVVATLLGADTSIGAFSLSLTGSSFSVNGDGPFNEVKWWLTDDPNEISVEVTAWEEMPLNSDILMRAARQIEQGIELLVFEKSERNDEPSSD